MQNFPFVVAGRRHKGGAGSQTCSTKTGGLISLPVCDKTVVTDILAASELNHLASVPLYRIIAFLKAVGERWKSREYARRRSYVRQLQQWYGYSEKAAEAEANWIALLLCSHSAMHDAIALELGDRQILDFWIRREDAEVRAFPRGLSLHVLAGNVPTSSVVSILRALLTKNTVVAKASSDDYLTPLNLALSFRDVDEDHPVTRALSVVYWAGGQESPDVTSLVKRVDLICAWGGEATTAWAMSAAKPSAEVIRFGPKRSFGVVAQDADLQRAADGAAHDISIYDQNGCFSVLQLFVQAPLEPFLQKLQESLDVYAHNLLPPAPPDLDEAAASNLALLEADFACADIRKSSKGDWAIVVGPPELVGRHPRRRLVYVHPILGLDEIARHIDNETQTLAMMPVEAARPWRDAWALRGATRIVELGLNNVFRLGSAHDCMYPMQRMVRFVSQDSPAHVHPKGITFDIDQTRLLNEDRFLELIT